jgi:protein gp37
MNKTKIDWADHTWNPVTGCRYNCQYCYARTMSKRFSGDIRLNKASDKYKHDKEKDLYILEQPFITRSDRSLNYPFGFEPTLHRYRMDVPQKLKQSKNIFVGSMADIFGEWVPDEWIEEVFKASEKSPQHNYLFLTKNPKRYVELIEKKILRTGSNYWYGTTTTAPEDIFFSHNQLNTFVSIEPILEPWSDEDVVKTIKKVDWIIIGAETGNRKDKVVPKKEWITTLMEQGRESGIPILLKNSLRELMGEGLIQEFPDGLKKLEKIPRNTALYKRLYSSCGSCKKTDLKSEMIAILARRKRGETAKQLAYLCETCFKKIEESEES